eukprot:CAMPEP_0180559084 /NCGR_PEP_ID=MMETSP1037_2-20121125/2100_1 /TAXON_ID=632150 /ORGANISM="Azadinium spinosum, Strain 3D9" /LENGTH=74 /DNA_ID=CAMNT_0022575517 /DNA_START=11 /DNA_END=235 /DNA_ORIENTATION=-
MIIQARAYCAIISAKMLRSHARTRDRTAVTSRQARHAASSDRSLPHSNILQRAKPKDEMRNLLDTINMPVYTCH